MFSYSTQQQSWIQLPTANGCLVIPVSNIHYMEAYDDEYTTIIFDNNKSKVVKLRIDKVLDLICSKPT